MDIHMLDLNFKLKLDRKMRSKAIEEKHSHVNWLF